MYQIDLFYEDQEKVQHFVLGDTDWNATKIFCSKNTKLPSNIRTINTFVTFSMCTHFSKDF